MSINECLTPLPACVGATQGRGEMESANHAGNFTGHKSPFFGNFVKICEIWQKKCNRTGPDLHRIIGAYTEKQNVIPQHSAVEQ